MPPQVQFSRENIIEGAFDIFRKEGMEGITARKVAKRLGSSVGPIYTYFENIQELQRELLKKTVELMDEYSIRPWTDIPFLNMGVGYVCFARDEPVLFNNFFIDPGFETNGERDHETYIERMRRDPMLRDFSRDELVSIFTKMSYFSYGMAVEASQGMMRDSSTESIIELLKETGADIIFVAKVRSVLKDPKSSKEDLNGLWGYFDE
ncbi:MAG: TetR/AcrR family transcriptional regulator [Thermoplasmatota archaeon]